MLANNSTDATRLRPLLLYDRSAWWDKARQEANGGPSAFSMEEGVRFVMEANDAVHGNATVCHGDRLALHAARGRRFVTPPYHGLGGCCTDIVRALHARHALPPNGLRF